MKLKRSRVGTMVDWKLADEKLDGFTFFDNMDLIQPDYLVVLVRLYS